MQQRLTLPRLGVFWKTWITLSIIFSALSILIGVLILTTQTTTFRPSSVHAEAPASPFTEHVDLQFYVKDDYTVEVTGIIVLSNISGKDVSLTLYDMNLPYFVLKDTKIVYVYPTQFLVDMYAKNNSMLFTFKSAYTNPVIISKNGKITIQFSAQLKDPYRDVGGLRVLAFPFNLKSEERSVSITVSVAQSLPLIHAPATPKTLSSKRIYEVSEDKGRLFLFLQNENPIYITLTSSTELPLPPFPFTSTCSTFLPVSCVGCNEIRQYPERGQLLANKKADSNNISVTFAKTFSKTCAQETVTKSSTTEQVKNESFIAGYIIDIEGKTLIPAYWRERELLTHKELSNVTTGSDPYSYVDTFGYLSIPLFTCKTDTDCVKNLQLVKSYDTGISKESSVQPTQYKEATISDIAVSFVQKGNQFSLKIDNVTDSFLILTNPTLANNDIFDVVDTTSRILPPKQSLMLSLVNKKTIQTSNQPTELYFTFNNTQKTLSFKPVTILILSIIEVLSYVFVVTVGISLFSVLGIILYNKRR